MDPKTKLKVNKNEVKKITKRVAEFKSFIPKNMKI